MHVLLLSSLISLLRLLLVGSGYLQVNQWLDPGLICGGVRSTKADGLSCQPMVVGSAYLWRSVFPIFLQNCVLAGSTLDMCVLGVCAPSGLSGLVGSGLCACAVGPKLCVGVVGMCVASGWLDSRRMSSVMVYVCVIGSCVCMCCSGDVRCGGCLR
jgi:hypothetical protein